MNRRFGTDNLRFRSEIPGRWRIDRWEPIGSRLGTWQKTDATIEHRVAGHHWRTAGWYFVPSRSDEDSGERAGFRVEDAARLAADRLGTT